VSTLPPTPSACSISPLFFPPDAAALSGQSRVLDAMFSGAFHKDAQLIRGDPRRSVHLACGLLARGDVPVSDVTRNVERLQRELHMVHWNPDGACGGCCELTCRCFAGTPVLP
jgi:tubulin epsilon